MIDEEQVQEKDTQKETQDEQKPEEPKVKRPPTGRSFGQRGTEVVK